MYNQEPVGYMFQNQPEWHWYVVLFFVFYLTVDKDLHLGATNETFLCYPELTVQYEFYIFRKEHSSTHDSHKDIDNH